MERTLFQYIPWEIKAYKSCAQKEVRLKFWFKVNSEL
jgi:hypothetical protein